MLIGIFLCGLKAAQTLAPGQGLLHRGEDLSITSGSPRMHGLGQPCDSLIAVLALVDGLCNRLDHLLGPLGSIRDGLGNRTAPILHDNLNRSAPTNSRLVCTVQGIAVIGIPDGVMRTRRNLGVREEA